MFTTEDFIQESNRIEGIHRDPTPAEIAEHDRFVSLPVVTVAELERFVSIYQPNAMLRDRPGLNARVGNHTPPPGGPMIRYGLETILEAVEDGSTPYEAHCQYETLHPFTDGNGRSGRALWAWHMVNTVGGYPLGFLHHWYYQSLQATSR